MPSLAAGTDRDIRVCFVGDSFVAGVGDSSGLGWTGRVVAAAAAAGVQLTAYNLGIRRQTSRQIADRLPIELSPRLHGQSDPRVVISFGVNDCTPSSDAGADESGAQRVSPAQTHVAVLDAITAVGRLPLLFVGPPPVADEMTNQRIEVANGVIRSACAAAAVRYIDIFEALRCNDIWRTEVAIGDGAHPDSAGYAELFSLIDTDLLAWLREPAKTF